MSSDSLLSKRRRQASLNPTGKAGQRWPITTTANPLLSFVSYLITTQGAHLLYSQLRITSWLRPPSLAVPALPLVCLLYQSPAVPLHLLVGYRYVALVGSKTGRLGPLHSS